MPSPVWENPGWAMNRWISAMVSSKRRSMTSNTSGWSVSYEARWGVSMDIWMVSPGRTGWRNAGTPGRGRVGGSASRRHEPAGTGLGGDLAVVHHDPPARDRV